MDDPLRPKTVPLAAETILWFEFLLDPTLLTTHLSKPNPDPSSIELVSQFISMSPDHQIIQYDLVGPGPISSGPPGPVGMNEPENFPCPSSDGLKLAKKQLALKILTLKTSTFIKWNLDVIEKSLPIQKQLSLLRDLCTISLGKACSIPIPPEFDCTPTAEGSDKASRFALTLYHRWVLRLQILKDIAIKNMRPIMHMLMPSESINFIAPEISTEQSVEYLTNLCDSQEPFYIFSYDTFVALNPNSDRTTQNFNFMIQISNNELRAQLFYDLVGYYLYSKRYKLAKRCVIECQKAYTEMKKEYQLKNKTEYNYCHVDENELHGLLLACGVTETPLKLIEDFKSSFLNNNFRDIVEILKKDNHLRQIPLVNRRIVELDIEGAISQGHLKSSRELEMNVSALNVIRNVIDSTDNIFQCVDYFEKYKSMDYFEPIIEGISDVLPSCTITEKNKIKEFLIDCILKEKDNSKISMKKIENLQLFSCMEWDDLKRQNSEEENIVPLLATQNDWKFTSKNLRIEIGSLERQLIACTNATTVRKLLVKLAATNPSKPLWTVNRSWQLPTPINSLLMSFQRGFLQDFAYVLLGKAREMSAKDDYVGAVSMLSVLKSETQRPELSNTLPIVKLGKFVTWEILLIQINQTLDEWNQKTLDIQSLAQKCKQCLAAIQSPDNIIPRIEIIEHCVFLLLNLNDWHSIANLDKRFTTLELPIAFAATFIELEKLKGVKKTCRDAWDLILAMFSSASIAKRTAGGTATAASEGGGGGNTSLNNRNSNTGGGGGNSTSSPSLVISPSLFSFFENIRDPVVFSLAISLLAKIHNILKDDSNFDITGDYMFLWPTTISNPIGYNIRYVSEILMWLLKKALKYYPQNTSWLKIKGDLELAIGNNEAAMRCYVNTLITATEYCILPLQRFATDDCVIRKMIRCSSNLGCYMQAAVLCQFLDEIDYSLAFKNISEKSSNFYDAMDAYYNCIWDPTLLEFIINLHSKKGEHNRRLEAISVISSLELNANNNEEIKREAASIRKNRFLRALAKQYLL